MCTATIVVVKQVFMIHVDVVVGVVKRTVVVVVDDIAIRISDFAKGVLVVMHPHFEYTSVNSNFTAEFRHQLFIPLLHLPPNSLCKLAHLFFLSLTELGPESLSPIWVRGCDAGHWCYLQDW